MIAGSVGGRSIGRRDGRALMRASVAGLLIATGAGPSLAQNGATQNGAVNNWLRDKPSGSNELTAGTSSGIRSEPPARPISGTDPGGTAATPDQGLRGNGASGATGDKAVPTK